MKVLAAYPSATESRTLSDGVLCWPDSATVKSGKPVFIPDCHDSCIFAALGVKVKAVGKSIKSRFAPRYYNDVLPLAFIINSFNAEKIKSGLFPAANNLVADYSVICGDSINADSLQEYATIGTELSPLAAMGSEEKRMKISKRCRIDLINEAICAASRDNTLKTGDFVAFILPEYFQASRNTLLKISLNGQTLIENKLK